MFELGLDKTFGKNAEANALDRYWNNAEFHAKVKFIVHHYYYEGSSLSEDEKKIVIISLYISDELNTYFRLSREKAVAEQQELAGHNVPGI